VLGIVADVFDINGLSQPDRDPRGCAASRRHLCRHRAELDELATTAIAELERSGESALKLPDQPFYDRASVAETFASEAIAVDFVVEEFYLPLVYVDTDEPQDIHDTCANGGRVVKPLAPHWYICQRDGN